jgi:phosphatidylglycerol---prolipoprotein diacylglyceryl transferase
MHIHLVLDLLAYSLATTVGFIFKSYLGKRSKGNYPVSKEQRMVYNFILINGVILGSLGLGTLNAYISGEVAIGKSIVGAFFGGVLFAEVFKYFTKIKGSTGLIFVPSLCVGVVVGRLGCYFSGLADYTYGIATSLPWAVDFGDGILRHPVQLYESIAVGLFLLFFLWKVRAKNSFFLNNGFYLFITFYSAQRFAWEFLKPYSALVWKLNLFHFVTLSLIIYGLFMISRNSNSQNYVIRKSS